MGKILVIAEKPSVGRDISNVLNCRENGTGCRIGDYYIVTWAVGHLVGLCHAEMTAKVGSYGLYIRCDNGHYTKLDDI